MLSYETAVKLKEAGFPRPSPQEGKYLCDKDNPRNECLYVPTLSELIEAVTGQGFNHLSYVREEGELDEQGNIQEWLVLDTEEHSYFGSSPEEAVALLWLNLNK